MIRVHCLLLKFSSNSCAGIYITYIGNINLITKIFMHELHISNNFRYGACDINITDQERELNNQISSQFYRFTGTQHRITAAYHPQSNGLVERSHRTIEDMIHKQVTPPDVNWLEILDSVLFAIRVSQALFNQNKILSRSYMDVSPSCHLKWIMKLKKAIQ